MISSAHYDLLPGVAVHPRSISSGLDQPNARPPARPPAGRSFFLFFSFLFDTNERAFHCKKNQNKSRSFVLPFDATRERRIFIATDQTLEDFILSSLGGKIFGVERPSFLYWNERIDERVSKVLGI